MKLQQHRALKLILVIVLGEILFRGLRAKRDQTRAQNEVLQVLWKIDDA